MPAATLTEKGVAFADALHSASSAGCERVGTFDDRRLVRRARRLGLSPTVAVPD